MEAGVLRRGVPEISLAGGLTVLGDFSGRRVAVVGMGKSNRALARYLMREGARVTCFDQKTSSGLGDAHAELSALGASWSLGEGYLAPLPEFRWIFLTPGMKKGLPEIVKAKEAGAIISTETALFLERCKARVAGVTGSAGKTTTSTLVGLMLRESLPETPVYVGGNIGEVLIEKVESLAADALVVMELSSFQLELQRQSPSASLILNVRPNHLDIHDSFEEYVAAKKNIYRFQGEQDWCVLNLDDPLTREMSKECPGRVAFFTLDAAAAAKSAQDGHQVAWLQGEELWMRGEQGPSTDVRLAGISDFLVPGTHNVANALAAAVLASALGASPEGIRRAIRSFRGVEHRIEFVRELAGVKYFNDSKATSPDETMALLKAVPGPMVLILGGYDKGVPFDEMAREIVRRGYAVVTMGRTAPKIERALADAATEPDAATGASDATEADAATGLCGAVGARRSAKVDVVRAGSLDQAVQLAREKAGPGSSVALSPACASYDMFANFEERGTLFKEIVRRLV